ncbi:MAG: methylenetetrahydrofolate reductase [NAD(P)H] [Holosporaceae bacterium]|jgi:methylenetetrahydrofolate reductase (NADPH)|nr:methylenetetrahydrofolate reductase [NAD(P)H] [Holosporaceae bacterium]
MYLSELFQRKRCVFSCEIFPPKKNSDIDSINQTILGLERIHPDFISVTCGAGGCSIGDNLTIKVAKRIKEYGLEPLVHLTCVNSSCRNLEETVALLKENNIDNILALRGDRAENSTASDFAYASDLISFIRQKGDFYVVAACYPEGHPESNDMAKEILHLKEKIEAGAGHLISQLFFDNDRFYAFMNKLHAAGIDVPVEAGIMPVVDKRFIEKIVSLCGATLPVKFLKMLDRFKNSPAAFFEAGIAYATEQIVDLISAGVRGIHLYTMNNPDVAEKIAKNIEDLLRNVNDEPS